MIEQAVIEQTEEASVRPLPALARPIFAVAEWSARLSSVSMIILAVIVVADIIGRAFSAPLSGGSDIGTMLMVGLIFFAVAGTQADNDHVSMDALVVLFPRRLRKLTDRINLLICFGVASFLAYGTVKAAVDSYASGEMALGAMMLPLWPSKAIVAFGLTLYALVILAQFFGAEVKPNDHDSMPAPGTD